MKEHLVLMSVVLSLCVFGCQPGERTAEPGMEETQGVQFQTIGLAEATAQAKDQNKLILIDFFSPT